MIIEISQKDKQTMENAGIFKECISIIDNCECGINTDARIENLDKMRRWEIMETIGNNIDPMGEIVPDWNEIKRIATFCKAFEIPADKLSEYYAEAINESTGGIAYAVTENLVLILSNRFDFMPKSQFKEYCIKSIESDFQIEIGNKLDDYFEIAWNNVNPRCGEDYIFLLLAIKQHVLNYDSEARYNVSEWIQNRTGFKTDIRGITHGRNSIEVQTSHNWINGNNVFELMESIDNQFNLKCDWKCYANQITIWIELPTIEEMTGGRF